MRVNDGEPGVELQLDFGHMGYRTDPADGRRRKVHALIFTFFGGVFKVLIPDNLKPVVTDADAVNPRLSQG